MKVLLACDDYCFSLNGKFYLREFGLILVKRYLSEFEYLRLAIRTKYVNSEDELREYNCEIDTNAIEVYPIPFFQGPLEYLQQYWTINRRLKNVTTGCDTCICRLPSTIGFSVIGQVKINNLKYGVEIVANPKDLFLKSNGVYKFLWAWIHLKLKKASKGASCISYVTKHSLQSIYPSEVIDHFATNYSSVELNHDFFTRHKRQISNSLNICHVSNPIKSDQKGHRCVIDIIRILRERGINAKVVFAGEGSYVKRFMDYADINKVGDYVQFVGLLDKKKLYKLFLESDFMVFPTVSEGLPRAIIEAMATALPCLSSSVGGIPELIDDEFLFSPNEPNKFVEKIIQIIDDPKLYNYMQDINYERSKEYSSDNLELKRSEMFKMLKDIIKN